MKKALTVILIVICGLIANVLMNAAVIAAWGFNGAGAGWSVLVGIAAAAAVCALGVTVSRKLRVRRRTLLICAQAPALAVAAFLFAGGLVQYLDVMSSKGGSDMWSGLRYGLTVAFFRIYTVIFITVLLMTVSLALALTVTYIKEKDKRKRGVL